MERKIGEIFEYNGEWYQCVEGKTICSECDLRNIICQRDTSINNPFKECSGNYRTDKKNIIFKKLEKVGEPYYNSERKLCQQYKCYIDPLVTDEIVYVFADNRVVIEIKQTKEDMEENKLNLRPFDIQKAKEGKPVCTRYGRKARIICFDSIGGRPIVALVTECDDEEEIPYKYHCDGFYNCQSIPSDNDLMMLPEKRSGWAKVRKDINLYDSKEEADRKMIGNDEYVTAKVCWEE